MSLISRSPFGLRVDESPRDDAEARAFLSLAAALVGLVLVVFDEVLVVVVALVLGRPGGRLRPSSSRTARASSAAPRGATAEGVPGARAASRRSPRDGPLAARAAVKRKLSFRRPRAPCDPGGDGPNSVGPQGRPCGRPRRRKGRPSRPEAASLRLLRGAECAFGPSGPCATRRGGRPRPEGRGAEGIHGA